MREVPFFHPEGDDKAEKASLRHHAERAISVMNGRVIQARLWQPMAMGTETIPCSPLTPHARAPVQRLDGDAPLPDPHRLSAAFATVWRQ